MVQLFLHFVGFAFCLQACVALAGDDKAEAEPVADKKPNAQVPAKAAAAQAQVKRQPNVPTGSPAVKPEVPQVGLMMADRPIRVRLIRAKELLAIGETAAALPLLHAALQAPLDAGYAVDSLDRTLLRSIRWEAEDVVGRLSPEDRETYELLFSPDADRALELARANFDLDALAEVSRRYFHTKAGHDATSQLAAAYFDLGRPLDAGLWFDRLKNNHHFRPDPGHAAIALRSAVAWSMSGMPNRASQILVDLTSLGPRPMQIGAKQLPRLDDMDTAERWLQSLGNVPLQCRPHSAIGWSLVGGNTSRNASSRSTTLATASGWEAKTSTWKVRFEDAPFSNGMINVARQIGGVEELIRKKGVPPIPTTRPLVVDDTVVVKSLSQLQAFDLASGELKWQTNESNEFEQVRKGTIKPLPGDTGSILDPMLHDRVFGNSTYGTMSSNGQLVFYVSGLGYLEQPKTPTNYFRPPTPSTHPLGIKSFNSLVAHDVATGKRTWRVGGTAPSPSNKLAGRFFLGPPLPLGGQLFCLTEQGQRIELVVLNASTGQLDWIKPLRSFGLPVTSDSARATAGLSPSYSDGKLICPTGSGVVVALDLATRQSVWSYRYRDLDDGNLQNKARMLAMARLAAQRRGETLPVEKPGSWFDACPIIVRSHIIMTPRDSKDLLCLDLASGRLKWKVPREDRVFVGGVHRMGLILVSGRRIELLNLQSGNPVWKQPIDIPGLAGRGVILGRRFHIPLTNGRLATVEIERGEMKITEANVIGNLVVASDAIVLQSPTTVSRLTSTSWPSD